MRFALMTEPQQGLSYDEILDLARAAEAAGLEAFFRSDHYGSFPAPDWPTTDAWTTLAGLARDTERIGLGALVSPVTFRIPGSLAKVVATVDEMSGGRVEVGIGAGWNDEEHAQLGIGFPDLVTRYDMLEETLQIVHRLWTDADGWTFSGAHWQVRGAQFHAKPQRAGRRHPPIILGGKGGPRSARLTAQWADEFNLSSASPEAARDAFARIDDACRAIGRDPATVTRSVMTGVLLGENEGEVRDRSRLVVREMYGDQHGGEEWLKTRRGRWVMGTLEEASAMVSAFAAAGAERVMLQDFLPRDLEMVHLAGRLGLAVAPGSARD